MIHRGVIRVRSSRRTNDNLIKGLVGLLQLRYQQPALLFLNDTLTVLGEPLPLASIQANARQLRRPASSR
jgi:hypothetical protein